MLEGWLRYLCTNPNTQVFAGDKSPSLEKLEEMSCGEQENFYFAECPLMGAPYFDLAVELRTKQAVMPGVLPKKTPAELKAFLERYYNSLPEEKIYLEYDLGTGDDQKAALFVDAWQHQAEEVLEFFRREDLTAATKETLAVLQEKLSDGLQLKYIGRMFSREQQPLRLGMGARAGLEPGQGWKVLKKWLRDCGFREQIQQMEKAVGTIMLEGWLQPVVSFDVFPDGSLGETIGLELAPAVNSYKEQQPMLLSKELQEFLKKLVRLKMADERVCNLPACVFYAPLDSRSYEYLFSRIFHFKLRWNKEKSLPAKLYLLGYRGRK